MIYRFATAAIFALSLITPATAQNAFGDWRVGIVDMQVYVDLQSYEEVSGVCALMWSDGGSAMLVGLVPEDIRIIQSWNADWSFDGAIGVALLKIGSISLVLSDAIFLGQFVDHVSSGADGATHMLRDLPILLSATGSAPSTVNIEDASGSVLLSAPFEGFASAIERLYECYEVSANY